MGIEPIAVVGLAVRVPDAAGPAQFWANLADGRNSIHELTQRQLLDAGESPAALAAPNYRPFRPLLDDPWGFDAAYFGMSGREAELRNPQHRLFLELCETALQDAAIVPERCDGSIGVYGGCATDRFVEDHIRADPELLAQVGEMIALVSSNIDYLAPFVSFRLGLRGPSISVRTACSTSLVATHLACQALRAGDCDVALAGGVEIETPYGRGYLHIDGGIDSADGVCRPLDTDASGTVFGSGGGVVALRRLADARAAGDRVLALIRGTAVNNDGAQRAGFTAPSWEGQSLAVAEAIAVAGVDPATISYIELHGTGTRVGDPIEIRGLHRAMELTASGELPPASCAVGSVKSNLGHLGPASGVVGLIKTVLALRHEVIPPTINIREVNPALELDRTPFTAATRTRPWPRADGAPRRAGVSSFGFGGTNAHAVLEEAPLDEAPLEDAAPERDSAAAGPCLLAWSGTDEQARDEAGRALLAVAAGAAARDVPDIAWTSRAGRRELRCRAALRLPAEDAARAAAAALEAADLAAAPGMVTGSGGPRSAVLMFPGQGSQYPGMGADSDGFLPGFAADVRDTLGGIGDLLGIDLAGVWEHEADPAVLAQTVHAQPLLYATGLAAARSLGRLGLRPALVLGHSIGELVAATVAGVLDPDDAIGVVAERARLMRSLPPGQMLAVAAPAADLEPLLGGQVWISALNHPSQTVVGGPAGAIAEFGAVLDARKIRHRALATSHAFHTPAIEPMVAEFTAAVAAAKLSPPRLPMISALTGAPLSAAEAVRPEFWARQVAEPVRLSDALAHLPGDAVLVEAGPGTALTGLARRHPAAAGSPVIPLLPGRPGRHVLDALAELWVQGAGLDIGALPAEGRRKHPLPAYPYRRTVYLLPDRTRPETPEPAAAQPAAPGVAAGAGAGAARSGPDPDAEPVIAVPMWQPAGVLAPARPAAPGSRGRAVVLFPADLEAAGTVRDALQLAGYRVAVVPGRAGEAGSLAGASLEGALDAVVDDRATLLVHAAGMGDPDAGDGGSARDMEFLLSVLAVHRYAARRRLPVLVLTESGVAVTGAEGLRAERAAAAAVVRSAVLEGGAGASRMLDVAGTGARLLGGEIGQPRFGQPGFGQPGFGQPGFGQARLAQPGSSQPGFGDPVLAVRGQQAWRAGRVRLPLPDWPGLLEPGGRYLITGGLGGVGLAVADGLAATGLRPHLILVSRSPDGADARIAAIQECGARVTVEAGDAADPAGMAALLDRVTAEHGPVHGIVHAAGVPGGALIRNRELADAAAVLRPKIAGAAVLAELAREAGVRFLALFSSRAALNGLVGSADYAAANAYLDALAQAADGNSAYSAGHTGSATSRTGHTGHTSIISINWPTWFGVGMAAQPAAQPVGQPTAQPAGRPAGTASGGTRPATWRTRIAPADWLVAEHRLDGVPLVPATGIIDMLVRAVRSVAGDTGEAVELTDLTLAAPLTVERDTDVEVALDRAGDGWRATVRSWPADRATDDQDARDRAADDQAGSQDIRTHVTASAASRAVARPPRRDLPAEADGWPAAETGGPADSRFAFGPRFSAVTSVQRGDDPEVTTGVLELGTDFEEDLEVHAVHPALLDRALALQLRPEQHIPFGYRRVTVYRDLPGQLIARHRLRDTSGRSVVDAVLTDGRGRTLVEVEGFVKIPLAAGARVTGVPPGPAAPPGPVTQPPPSSPPAGTGIGLTTGITAEQGVAALLRLLCDGVGSRAIVVPAAEWADAGWADAVPADAVPANIGDAGSPAAPAPPPARAEPARTEPARTGPPPAAPDPPRPAADIPAQILRIWAETLGGTGLEPGSDFFAAGGDSLTALQVISRLRDRFGVELSVFELFDAPTATGLAGVIEAKLGGAS